MDHQPQSASRQSDKIEFANALRGVAAVSVVIAHLVTAFWLGQPLVAQLTGMPALKIDPPWFAIAFDSLPVNFASFGVGLFFVISGFVIPFSLTKYNARAFLVGRVLRIYPTYWLGFSLTIGSIAAGAAFFGGSLTYNAKEAILHYLPPLRALVWSKPLDGIVWTLEIELFFYLLCAALAGAIGAGRRAVAFVPLALFALWLPLYAFSAHPPAGLEKLGHRFEFLAVYLPFLIFMFTGVALNFRQRGLVSRAQAGLWIAVCVAMFLAAWATKFLPAPWAHLFVGVIEPESYMAALALFLAAMAAQDWFSAHPAMRFLSDISYPLYVVHGMAGFVALQVMTGAGVEPHIALGATLAVVFAASWAIHVLVETPTHQLGQRLAKRIMARKTA